MAGDRRTLSLVGTAALCGLSGVLLSLAFPPVSLWYLAWVGLAPWLVAVRMGKGWGATLLGSWVGGAAFFGALLYWLGLFGVSVWAMTVAALALYLVVWGLLVRWTQRLGPVVRTAAPAVLWCGIEWVRGLGEFGLTWGWLGYSQSPVAGVLPVARAFGTVGISLVIALANVGAAELVVAGLRRERAVGAVVRALMVWGLAGACLFGARAWAKRTPGPTGPEIRVAVIQGSAHGPLTPNDVNVPMTAREQRETLETYAALTRQASEERPTLVVWPESVIPGAPEEEPWVAARLLGAARASRAWLLAGGPYTDERGRTYNSAYLYSPSGNLTARYDKVKLVPFGEYVPGRFYLPFLGRYHVRDFDFTAGGAHRVLQAGTIAVGPMICFESIFPAISWELSRRRAQLLVVMTNDAWFGRTGAAAQHRQMAVLRAVETGRWVLRAASTGISSIIAPDGRVVAEAELFERKALSAKIRLATSGRAEPRWGFAFSWVMVGLSAAYVIAPGALPRRRAKGRESRRRSSRRPRGREEPR